MERGSENVFSKERARPADGQVSGSMGLKKAVIARIYRAKRKSCEGITKPAVTA
jgi:hypothetical protein